MDHSMNPAQIPVGVVGLGLMGCSIVACLRIAGHPVVAVAPMPADIKTAEPRIREHLTNALHEGLVTESPDVYFEKLQITEAYEPLKDCQLVVECTLETIAIKKAVYAKIEAVVSDQTLITSNTSAIPISLLQQETRLPTRFFGLHWLEPAHTTRFLEIICGDLSDIRQAEWLYELSYQWAKEPILVRKDIRGFVSNRLMYAMFREAFNLVENGYATVEDVDRACRNNAGYWMTLVGIFRWMDLTGVPAYHTVMKDLFPTLSNQTSLPTLIDDIVNAGGKGVLNAQGFYAYTPDEAQAWQKTYEEFSYEIRKLALKYPADVVEKKVARKDKQDPAIQ